jgi:isoquinoline 1-oxidoreductase subunit beta
MRVLHISRRSFLVALNLSLGGLALGAFPDDARAAKDSAQRIHETFNPNVFIHIANNGDTTIVCARSEMGQGVRSSLPVLFADELGADMARVTVVQADGDRAYGDQATGGSSSVRGRFQWLRRIGATARVMLVAAAAQKLHVPASSLDAHDHRVWHKASGRSIGFGELAPLAAKLPVPDAKRAPLRPRSELAHLGKALPLLDAPAQVTGRAEYAADVRLPGLLVAVIARPPVVGARVRRFDASHALAVPGVRHLVEMPEPAPPYKYQPWGGIAVVADNTWAALRGRALLAVDWTESENDGYDSTAFRAELERSVSNPGLVYKQRGDALAALRAAKTRVEADYYVPHLPHLSMEPPCATARLSGDQLEIWTSTQSPMDAQAEAARVTGLSRSDVVVHVTFLGGAFGRKAMADFVSEAAFLAKHLRVPVRVQWTREDDVQHDYYNAVSLQRLTAGLDAAGKVVAWTRRTAFPPISSIFDATIDTPSARDLEQGVLDLALDVPNVRAEACSAKAHVRIGWLRSVYNLFHAFATGCFFDEVAAARGVDPRDNLLELIGPPRHVSLAELGVSSLRNYGASLSEHPVDASRLRAVIERVTAACRWSDRHKDGRALGLAAHRSFLSYSAAAVSLKRVPGGRAHVDEVWVAVDAGTILNADRVRAQMEGSVLFGLSFALFGGVEFHAGRAVQSNFDGVRLVRVADAPRRIHVDIVKSELAPGGIGEPGTPPVAPALANAAFALSGERVRAAPFGEKLGM